MPTWRSVLGCPTQGSQTGHYGVFEGAVREMVGYISFDRSHGSTSLSARDLFPARRLACFPRDFLVIGSRSTPTSI